MHKANGFTLIELLVVLLVLSLVASMAVFSMGIFKDSHNLENSTQALSSRLRLAQLEALFEQEALGIALDERGYRFYRKDPLGSHWELIQNDSFFRAEDFPRDTTLSLIINGQAQSLGQTSPQLVLQQGAVAPFALSFHDKDNHGYEIHLNEEGEIEWTPL
jgi:general secretion pathway protein H